MGLRPLYGRAKPKAIQIDAHRGSSAICVRRSVLTPSYINISPFKNGGKVVPLVKLDYVNLSLVRNKHLKLSRVMTQKV